MHNLVFVENPVLRENALEVSDVSDVQGIIKAMKKVLHSEKYGVAIAAPQIGESLRIFIIAGHVFASRSGEEFDAKVHLDQVFVNPEVVKISKKLVVADEGCLSVPNKYGTKVERNEKITISYLDESGEKHVRGASSFLSRVFQHEIDHLNGILYTDNAIEVIEVDENLKPI